MKKPEMRSMVLIALVPLLGIGAAGALARAGQTVLYHGSVVSSEVSVINGRPYVPLSDMARALGGRVAPHAGGYEIVTSGSNGGDTSRTAEGGANQVKGQNGKVGDWFFNGYWRFKVSDVKHVDSYLDQFAGYSYTSKPDGANDELVVLTCQIKNGHQQAEEPILTAHGLATQATALTDDQGQSYAPQGFDVRNGALTPGAAKNFAVIFSVPKGTHLQSLIFTLYGYGVSSNKASNVRVSLGP